MQVDWALVGESDGLATDLADAAGLDIVDPAAVKGRLRRIRELIGERRRYLEIQPDPVPRAAAPGGARHGPAAPHG